MTQTREKVAAYGKQRREKHRALGLCNCGRQAPRKGRLTCDICLASILQSWIRRRYGITWVEYHERLREQRGLCAICHRKPRGRHRLSIDHNHKTKQVRGLLCQTCNVGIGAFEEKAEWFLQAVDYLSSWGDLK